ncbi:MAG: FAD-dependent monooxygenase [Planctomycetota bacterium]
MTQPTPEVVVIGAGPAGAGAALRLAQRGVSVLLVDRLALPRAKVCGGCLHRRGAARLAAWGVDGAVLESAGAQHLTRSELVSGGRTLRWPRGHGWSVDRAAFDFALVEAAAKRGATVEDRTAARVQRSENDSLSASAWSVRLRHADGDERIVTPRWVLVADGLGGSALCGLDEGDAKHFAVHRRPGSYIGAGVVLRDQGGGRLADTLPQGCVRMFVGEGGYVGAVRTNALPDRDEQAGIELAAAMRPSLVKQCGGVAAAAERLVAQATGAPPTWLEEAGDMWRMTPALTASRRRVAAPGLLVVGDAAGYVEPFTGEGMAWALEAADHASGLVCATLRGEQSREHVAQLWNRRCGRQRRLGRLWCWGTRAALRRPRCVAALTRGGQAWQDLTRRPLNSVPLRDGRKNVAGLHETSGAMR